MKGTFPLNVQEGSPQYTLVTQITPDTNYSIWIINTDNIRPINNAYYTIQNADGSKWCTFYASSWGQDPDGSYSTLPDWSSSNTSDVFPEGSVCWCIWCKEYYESLVTPISTINNDISAINGEINTLTPKVDNSFVSATKTNETTLRLTRNDGTTVDISFPKGLSVRTLTGQDINTLKSNTNELVVINSCTVGYSSGSRNRTVSIRGGLGYLKYTNPTDYSAIDVADGYNRIVLSRNEIMTVNGLLYNGAYVQVQSV